MAGRNNRGYKNKMRFHIEQLERKELLAADFIQQNPSLPTDVNDDGLTTPNDFRLIARALNSNGDFALVDDAPPLFMDVNADGELTQDDATAVIEQLNGNDPGPLRTAPQDRPQQGDRQQDGPQQNPAPLTQAADFASIDGTGNNLAFDAWGSVGQGLERWAAIEYADGFSEPAGEDRLSAREISNIVIASPGETENAAGLSDLTWLFGQFIDHDIDLSESGEEAFDIEVPAGDAWFDPFGTGEVTIGLNRTHVLDDTEVRTQFNEITAFIDGSVIYGSDQERADALRSFEGGRLATSDGDLLPFNEAGLANAGGDAASLFLAGDVRANENAALTSMHTLWVREHNRVADQISEDNPNLTDEEIYQRARQFVTAELQSITYNEFLPALLGEDAIADYQSYDSSVNPNIANVFSTAAYRFGHTMLSAELQRLNNDGTVIDAGNIALQDAFFNVDAVAENGIESLLLGASVQTAQEVDPFLVDDVRNFLFGPPGAGGFDLASLNIQRGRDHGLADYNQIRVDMGLDAVSSFADISSDPEIQNRLAEAYDDVNSIDAWVGMLAEDHVASSTLGITATTIIAEQFTRLRDGDRFYYENVFNGQQLNQIENTTLADVIERNTSIEFNDNTNVFFASDDGITTNDGGQNGGGGNGGGGNGGGGNGGGGNGGPNNGGPNGRRGDFGPQAVPLTPATPIVAALADAAVDDIAVADTLPPADQSQAARAVDQFFALATSDINEIDDLDVDDEEDGRGRRRGRLG